jgi:hypothetical protein
LLLQVCTVSRCWLVWTGCWLWCCIWPDLHMLITILHGLEWRGPGFEGGRWVTQCHCGEHGAACSAAAGMYSEQVLAGLDWLLVEARKRGLSLMMTILSHGGGGW